MGREVKCPCCGVHFHIHGHEPIADCKACRQMFEPDKHWAETYDVYCNHCEQAHEDLPADWKPRRDGERGRIGLVFCPECDNPAKNVGYSEELYQ